jgi:predicted HTH domain antitoxin
MSTITIAVSDDLVRQLEPYRDQLDALLRVGLRDVKMAASLALFKEGGISLWKAARLAGVSLREMTQYAVAQGVRATADEDTVREELA